MWTNPVTLAFIPKRGAPALWSSWWTSSGFTPNSLYISCSEDSRPECSTQDRASWGYSRGRQLAPSSCWPPLFPCSPLTNGLLGCKGTLLTHVLLFHSLHYLVRVHSIPLSIWLIKILNSNTVHTIQHEPLLNTKLLSSIFGCGHSTNLLSTKYKLFKSISLQNRDKNMMWDDITGFVIVQVVDTSWPSFVHLITVTSS